MKPPTRSAFAAVPIPIRAPSSHASPRTATLTQMVAMPNESGVFREMPWCRTSHGESPSFDSSCATTARANTNSPATSTASRATRPPRTRGGACTSRTLLGWFDQSAAATDLADAAQDGNRRPRTHHAIHRLRNRWHLNSAREERAHGGNRGSPVRASHAARTSMTCWLVPSSSALASLPDDVARALDARTTSFATLVVRNGL